MKVFISKYRIFAILLTLGLCLASCGGKDEPNTEMPQSDRTYLEESATQFLSLIKPTDQRNLIVALKNFVVLCETYKFPYNFYDQDVQQMAAAASYLAETLENDDYYSISRATEQFIYSMARFKGLYQANSTIKEWQCIDERESMDFRYWVGSAEYNISLQGDGGEWSVTVPESNADYIFNVPKNLTLTMYTGSIYSEQNRYIDAVLNTDGKDGSYLNTSLTGSSNRGAMFANIEVKSNTKATNTKVTEDLIVYYNNTTTFYRTPMIQSTMEIRGKDICCVSTWTELAEFPERRELLSGIFSSGSVSVDFIDRLTLKFQSVSMDGIFDNLGVVWTSSDARDKALAAAMSLTGSTKAGMYYIAANPATERGTLGWEAYLYNDTPGAQAWAIRPTITLTSDNSTYDFKSFFGNGRFLSVERQITSLLNQYKSYLK